MMQSNWVRVSANVCSSHAVSSIRDRGSDLYVGMRVVEMF